MSRSRTIVAFILLMLAEAGQSYAHTQKSLVEFNSALEELTARVSPAVVQILVSGYGPSGAPDSTKTPVFVRQQGIGSGVVLDSSGYIMTNAHVVKSAERIQVVLTKRFSGASDAQPPIPEQSVVPAKVVGMTDYFDLALLKIEAQGLPTLSFADFRKVAQGQLVVAIGSPQGFDNSATIGIISSVARQADGSSPIAYVQTDAPINPGNSGGALVDVDGNLIGMNTFIITQGGGSEGLGFALPAPIVRMAYEDLRATGHVDRRTMGIGVQQITPTMARGLDLPRINGLIVCDVMPGGPGEEAGIKVGDIIIEAAGRSVTAPPQLNGTMYAWNMSEPLNLVVLRDKKTIAMTIKIVTVDRHPERDIDAAEPQKNMIRQLGVMAATITPEMAGKQADLRVTSGVVVIARTADPTEAELNAGDVIHSINNVAVADIDSLRCQVENLKHGDAVVLQVERQGGLEFVTFEVE